MQAWHDDGPSVAQLSLCYVVSMVRHPFIPAQLCRIAVSYRSVASSRTLVAVLAIGCSSDFSVDNRKDGGAADGGAGTTSGSGGSSSGGTAANASGGSSTGGMNASGSNANSGGRGGASAAAGGSPSAGRGGAGAGGTNSGGATASNGGAAVSDAGASGGSSGAGNPNLCGAAPCTATRCAGVGCGPAVCCEGPNGPVCIHGATECPGADGGVRTEKLQCLGGSMTADFARSCSRDSECFVAEHWSGCCHIDAVGLNVTEQTAFTSFETSCGGRPACGCCCDRIFTESGMTVASGTALSVRCVDGMCTTSSP